MEGIVAFGGGFFGIALKKRWQELEGRLVDEARDADLRRGGEGDQGLPKVGCDDVERFYAFGRVSSGTIATAHRVRIQGMQSKPGMKQDLRVTTTISRSRTPLWPALQRRAASTSLYVVATCT